MKLHVLSDLHVRGADDEIFLRLCGWLRTRPGPGDFVILAGDIFDLYVGAKEMFAREYHAFFEALRDASSRGILLHYIEGNHDFEHTAAFRGIPGMRVDPDRFQFELSGKRILVEHGDLADRSDLGYRALRGFLRSIPMKIVIRLAPDGLVSLIGGNMRARSEEKRKKQDHLPRSGDLTRIRTAYRSYAAEKMKEGFDFVIMGHCHDLDEMRFLVDGRATHYMNVGYPRAHGSIVVWDSGDSKLTREEFTADSGHAATLRS